MQSVLDIWTKAQEKNKNKGWILYTQRFKRILTSIYLALNSAFVTFECSICNYF